MLGFLNIRVERRQPTGVPMAGERILVVEDEIGVLEMTLEVMRSSSENYEVQGATDAPSALAKARSWKPDLILLDLNLGRRFDGLDVCRAIRADPSLSDVGVVVLTGELLDTAEAMLLDAGADDYVRKPHFTPQLLDSRVRAVLRRTRKGTASSLRHGPLIMNAARREASINDAVVPLTPTEFDILHRLAINADRAMARHELLDRGGELGTEDRTVDVHILSIRRKLKRNDWLIQTVFGVGYRLGTGATQAPRRSVT